MKETTTYPPFTVTRAAIEESAALGGAGRIDAEDGGCCGTAYAYARLDPTAPRRQRFSSGRRSRGDGSHGRRGDGHPKAVSRSSMGIPAVQGLGDRTAGHDERVTV